VPYKTTTPYISDDDIDAALKIGDRIRRLLKGEEKGIIFISLSELLISLGEEFHGEAKGNELRAYLADFLYKEPVN
jgi:hypothetical protein